MQEIVIEKCRSCLGPAEFSSRAGTLAAPARRLPQCRRPMRVDKVTWIALFKRMTPGSPLGGGGMMPIQRHD